MLAATVAASAVCAVAVPAHAAPSTVTAGELSWSMANFYASGNPARTFLGYVTQGPGSFGSASAAAPATVTDTAGNPVTTPITAASPNTTADVFTFTYPNASGSYDEHTGEGSISFQGTVAFTPHGQTYTIVDPLLTLDGGSATLSASGVKNDAPYGHDSAPTNPLLTFDVADADVRVKGDGSRVFEGILKTGVSADFFGPPLPAQGTEGFSLRLRLAPDAGSQGPRGDAGPVGPTGPAGTDGKTVIERIQIAVLAKAPFGRKARKVRVLRGGKVFASGRIKGRRLTVTLARRAGKRLKGRYVLRVVGGKRRAVVRLG